MISQTKRVCLFHAYFHSCILSGWDFKSFWQIAGKFHCLRFVHLFIEQKLNDQHVIEVGCILFLYWCLSTLVLFMSFYWRNDLVFKFQRLVTPPDTPLFPSLDDEPPPVNAPQRGRPRSQPISISRSSTVGGQITFMGLNYVSHHVVDFEDYADIFIFRTFNADGEELPKQQGQC